MKIFPIVTILILEMSLCLFAQNQNNIWYFGDKAGVDFNMSPPKAISGKLSTLEGTASICDPSGNLLFYTNGVTVWDRSHNVMPNGTGLMGGESSTQSALIVPLPNSCSKYYLFTSEDQFTDGGVAYSIIDMCLHNGLGDIVPSTQNTPVVNRTAEKITAILHTNGVDIWILTHKLGSNQFLAYSLTAGGLNLTPVISSIGSTYDLNAYIGPVRASHDGTKVISSASFYHICEMFDFNSSTGKLSNLYNLNQLFGSQQWIYGIEFSPNDSILYLSTFYVTNYLFQINLKTKQVVTLNSIPGKYHYGALQMGPDRKIYMARNDSAFLDVIVYPDLKGFACQYVEKGLKLLPGTASKSGLPNFAPYSFLQENYTVHSLGNDTTICAGYSIVLSAHSPTNCASNFLWNDGSTALTKVVTQPGLYWLETTTGCSSFRDSIQIDAFPVPDISFSDSTICEGESITLDAFFSGARYLWYDNTTTPAHDFSKNGLYWVNLNNECYSVSDTFRLNVTDRPDVSFPDSTLCIGNSLVLNASIPDGSYTWSDGSTAPILTIDKEGTYWVDLTNSCFSERKYVRITAVSVPSIVLTDTVLCNGGSLLLDASSPGARYSWSDHSTSPKLRVECEGEYWVIITNKCGSDTASSTVSFSDCDFDVFVPNVFSPNGDGTNDYVKPFINVGLLNYEFSIFDRWGNCVFKSSDNQEYWDGLFNNKLASQGVYAYSLDCKSVRGIRKQLTGDITLLR